VTNGGVTLAFIGTLSIKHEALRFRPRYWALNLPDIVKFDLRPRSSGERGLLDPGCSLVYLFTGWDLRLRWKDAVLRAGIRRGQADW